MMRWMIPTCRKMGRMNRHHSVYIHVRFLSGGRGGKGREKGKDVRSGVLPWKPPCPQICSIVQPVVGELSNMMLWMNLTRKKKMTSYNVPRSIVQTSELKGGW